MSKFKIIDKPIKVTDAELESFMDFEQVLDRTMAQSLQTRIQQILTRRFLIIIGAVAVVGTLSYIFLASDTNTQESQTPGPVEIEQSGDAEKAVLEIEEPAPEASETPQAVTQNEKQKAKRAQIKKQEHPSVSDAQVTKTLDEADQQPEEEPVTYTYEDAVPINGIQELYGYFDENLTYPEEAIGDSIVGDVIIRFTVSKTGAIKNVIIEKSLGELFDVEARRLIEQMPPWKPATVNGDSVDSRISVPLHFRIE